MFGTISQSGTAQAVLACACYATCSTALTLANKHTFSHSLNYPWTLLGIQSICVSTILILFQLLVGGRVLSLTLIKQIFLPCLLFTVFIFSNTQALRFVSLPVLSVIKSLAPMGITAVEHIVFGDHISSPTVAAMFMIIAGNAVTMVNDVEYSLQGYVWAILNVSVNIAYVVSLRAYLSDNFSPIEKALHSNLTAAVLILPLSVASGEIVPFFKAIQDTDTTFRVVYMISCILAGGIGASVFWVIQTSSGSTFSFVGACNKFVVIILGGIIFKANISSAGWLSIGLGVLAGVIFAVAKARDQSQGNKTTKNEREEQGVSSEQLSRPRDCGSWKEHRVLDVSSEEEENDNTSQSLLR